MRIKDRVVALSVGAAMLCSVSFAQNASLRAAPKVVGVESVALSVADMDREVEFYTHVLPFEKLSDSENFGREYEELEGLFGLRQRVVRLRLGSEILELDEYLTPRGRSFPEASRSNDRWFQHVAIIVSDMDKAFAQLREHHLRYASPSPQRLPDWNPNAGGIKAFYFKDPEDHVLEILQFPEGKGAPKWHQPSDRVFLGIDHTAIVVSDTDESLKFYRDVLGLKVAGESMNYGDEQEHLNNVFGARLRITSLRGSSGPAIELLEYLSPRDGRPYPADSRPSDLWQWQTRLTAMGLEDLYRNLIGAHARFLSPGPVDLPAGAPFHRGLTVRDPDGHVMQFAEP